MKINKSNILQIMDKLQSKGVNNTNQLLNEIKEIIRDEKLDSASIDFLKEIINSQHRLRIGQYLTPQEVVYLMVDLVPPKDGDIVIDPTCGTGSYLIAASKKGGNLKLYGVDIEPNIIKWAEFFTKTLSIDVTFYNKNSLMEIKTLPKADVLFANIPWGGRISESDSKNFPIRSNIQELLFIQRFLYLTKDDATICMIVPEGFLFRSDKAHLKVREYIQKKHHIAAIIGLPPSAFAPYTGVKTSILILNKKRNKDPVYFSSIDDLTNKEALKNIVEGFRSRDIHKTNSGFWIDYENLATNWNFNFYDPKNKIAENKAKNLDYEIRLLQEIAEIIGVKQKFRSSQAWKYPVFKGDILFATDGTMGRPVLITQEKKIYESKTKYVILRLKKKDINPIYLLAYLKSQYTTRQIQKLQSGSFIPHLSLSALRYLQIIIPPVLTQKTITDSIASIYSDLESSVERMESVIKSVKEKMEQDIFALENMKASYNELFITAQTKLLASHPFPIAYLYHDLTISNIEPMKRFHRMLDLYEIFLKLSTILSLAILKNRGEDISKIVSKVNIKALTLGTWRKMFLLCRKEIISKYPTFKIDNFTEEDLQLLADFVNLRDDTRGHGSTLPEDISMKYVEENLPKLEKLISQVSYISSHKLFYPTSMRQGENEYMIQGNSLQGDHPNVPTITITWKTSLITDRVYFIKDSGNLSFSLHPWVIYEPCPECREKEILFYDKYEKGIPVYLGYKHGWKPLFEKYREAVQRELFIRL